MLRDQDGMKFLYLVIAVVCAVSSVEGAWIVQNGKIQNANQVPTMSCEKHYETACAAMEVSDWNTAVTHFTIIHANFPNSTWGVESAFFLGVSHFECAEYEMANDSFSEYLKGSCQPKYFQETMDYKFAIANAFREGAYRRPFGTKRLPKCLPGRNVAVRIYDEIIQAMPCHDHAAQSFWAKGNMLWEDGAYSECIESFQGLIRRFPKHELTPQAYVAINQVYLEESEWEFQNPDLLQLAEINYKKFKQEFPRDEKLVDAESDVQSLKESYAAGLLQTGQFYEKQGECRAALIYYQSAIKQFPGTRIAELCQTRLNSLQ